jgi:hypothetical protein
MLLWVAKCWNKMFLWLAERWDEVHAWFAWRWNTRWLPRLLKAVFWVDTVCYQPLLKFGYNWVADSKKEYWYSWNEERRWEETYIYWRAIFTWVVFVVLSIDIMIAAITGAPHWFKTFAEFLGYEGNPFDRNKWKKK